MAAAVFMVCLIYDKCVSIQARGHHGWRYYRCAGFEDRIYRYTPRIHPPPAAPRVCLSVPRRRLRAQLGAVAADSALLSHTVEEALAFDRQLDREAGYAECPTRFPGQSWPR